MNASVDDAHFSADWLARRECLDARSRSRCITGLAADWLAARPGVHRLVDLGAGSGSNLRFLAPRLPGPQRWRLVDHDGELLARARRTRQLDAHGERVAVSLERRNLAPVDDALLDDADLVVASALCDLVSRSWAEGLVDGCAARGQGLLITLTVDGDWAFLDASGERVDSDEDIAVRALVQAHQRRDKGLGPALGGQAPAVLAERLEAAGYRVTSVYSPWFVPRGERATLAVAEALVAGWYAAALEQSPPEGIWLARWHAGRRAQLAAGELGLTVGHRDLFATPGTGATA
ncbi:class I SAM-dependent methyltransferase [Halomonas faecis]|uniref:class I SAM-dependent methyltransferase n=1 Tax=Halomonas faecis TaxID=1562110 RepID=UPI0013CF6911|nr:class I SAM-dependent methyltransferase [Halomonas faecis]